MKTRVFVAIVAPSELQKNVADWQEAVFSFSLMSSKLTPDGAVYGAVEELGIL
jgi:2'-5' RNA ligase